MAPLLAQQHAENPETRLARLGLSPSLLRPVCERLLGPWQMPHPYWPPAARGSYAWLDGSTALREMLIPEGWRADDRHGLAAVVSPDESVRLLVSRGDENVGRPALPRSHRERGPYFIGLVDENVTQGELFDQLTMSRLVVKPEKTRIPTWVLLFFPAADELRFELSLPRAYSDDGILNDWRERIPLPSLSFDDAAGNRVPVTPPPPADVRFEVRLL